MDDDLYDAYENTHKNPDVSDRWLDGADDAEERVPTSR